jgi:hypothetical protein
MEYDPSTHTCTKCGKDFFAIERGGDFDFVIRFTEERIVKNPKTDEVYCWDCAKSELGTSGKVGGMAKEKGKLEQWLRENVLGILFTPLPRDELEEVYQLLGDGFITDEEAGERAMTIIRKAIYEAEKHKERMH